MRATIARESRLALAFSIPNEFLTSLRHEIISMKQAIIRVVCLCVYVSKLKINDGAETRAHDMYEFSDDSRCNKRMSQQRGYILLIT